MTPQKELKIVKQYYLELSMKELAKKIGRSNTYLYSLMQRNNLVIPKHIIQERVNNSRFQKGLTPFNKGLKITDYMSSEAIERSRKTRFNRNSKPCNKKKVGSISKRKDSSGWYYFWIKLESGKWVLYHRHLWEQKHGPIPEGYNVQFKDGDRENVDIDNLFLIEKKNQVIINKCGGLKVPVELHETILLKTSLNKKIRSYEK